MRWFSHSAREDILRGVSFGRRGEVLARRDAYRDDAQFPGHPVPVSSKRGIGIAFILFLLLVVGVFTYGYLSSLAGQRAVQDLYANIKKYTFDPISDFFASVFSAGAGDYFTSNVNSSSQKKGIDLAEFRSVTGDVVPAGEPFDLIYDIDFLNVPAGSTFDGNFYCSFNTSSKDSPPLEQRDGEIIPANPVVIRKGSSYLCRVHGEQTDGLNGAYTMYGSFSFDYATEDATLPVYFIPGDVADQLGDTDFFAAYGLDVRQSDLRTIYNGEPISVGIGVGGEGKEKQPVIVRSGDTLSYNTIGITLKNEWQGDVAALQSMSLRLPAGVSLSAERNGDPSLSCPFVPLSEGRGVNEYIMDETVRQQLFDYYIQGHAFFGKANYHGFQCWLEVDPDFIGEAPYVVKDYAVDVSYTYKVREQTATVTIVPKGASLVAGTSNGGS